ncbi:hypothetical protein CRG98_001329 [Punica granatum]|uniref:Uncharacterized protein n=1 Tax=Punica granatum TaxID=22663 RepID=A0A2I0LC73_PUNGR|nr:hypothetical protein CRG98_001329 [Punica granatum]
MEIIDGMQEHLRPGDHISIEITHPSSSLVSSIKEKMEDFSSSISIALVPENIAKENRRAYIPEKLSIGPFHRGNRAFKNMEGQKKPNLELESTIDKCMKAVHELEHRAKRCYSDIKLPGNEFEEMLLVDGSFIIELLIKYSNKSLRRRGDPIFGTPGKLFDLRCDMVLLENQIPMFVLQRLFQVVRAPEQCEQSLSDLLYRFFRNMIPGEPRNLREKFNDEAHHFLDLIHNCLIPTVSYPIGTKPQDETETIPSPAGKGIKPARELKRAGVKFKCRANNASLLDIDFKNGMLQIPPLVLNQSTERLFKNLVALEQTRCVNLPCVSSYVRLIHCLISSEKDEKLLEEVGIVTNLLDKDVRVSGLFRDICEGVTVEEDFHYEGLCDQVEEYCEAKKRKWKKLKRKRKNRSPGAVASLGSGSSSVLVVAVLILVFTALGAMFSALSFFLHRN